jgi:DNA-binding NarL/FixJ family response regulator
MVEHRTNGGTCRQHWHVSTSSSLDARECQILRAFATGLSSAEAAERLGLPIDAVRGLAKSAIVKLGARSKIEAVVIALRRRLIDLSPD